jgi:multidrug resistance efflux pump
MPNHHPNKVTMPTRPKISPVKTLWSYWPLAAWLGVVWFCYWSHRQGVKFRRMNAAVDVVQENVSPTREGFLKGFPPNIVRGAEVKKNDPVAILSDEALEEKEAILRSEIELELVDKIRDLSADLNKVKLDQLTLQTKKEAADAKGIAQELNAQVWDQSARAQIERSIEELKKRGVTDVSRLEAQLKNMPPNSEAQKARAAAAESKAESAGAAKAVETYQKTVADLEAKLKMFTDLQVADPKLLKPENLLLVATAGQQNQLKIIENRKEHLTLRAANAGIVDRINKEPGEFVKAGEGVLKIVGQAKQIVAFLPQDQLGTMGVGDKVWIVATRDRKTAFEGKIDYLAPRMNTVPDATSPIPNKRLFGQDVIISYPMESKMLPGQTVIVHLEDPKSVPLLSDWINTIFSNDDLGAQAPEKK